MCWLAADVDQTIVPQLLSTCCAVGISSPKCSKVPCRHLGSLLGGSLPDVVRTTDPEFAVGHEVQFADGFPILVATEVRGIHLLGFSAADMARGVHGLSSRHVSGSSTRGMAPQHYQCCACTAVLSARHLLVLLTVPLHEVPGECADCAHA